ncbi:DUF4382 domain-containing protein [Ramlibacter tataouinensis]|uniref:DUF4382 domain-containing protein n=1 Tax=Ramlibacter tataouinensis TaxID=94132 RepID=UPI0022F3BB52|nr:DUF4382 domain-containing protein [Ramlibacter tataouinensis]WBY02439.1 DUF4382 domain-containing protein [Ramlibacter tataouinensis]
MTTRNPMRFENQPAPGWKTWLALSAGAVLAACGGGGDGGATSAAPQGSLRLALTDAPSCGYDNVFVTVERVRVHRSDSADEAAGGWEEIVLDQPRRIDLLELTNGKLEELGQIDLPAGTYNQVRLVLAANDGRNPTANAVKPSGGAEVPLRTPSAQQSGLKLKSSFEVAEGGLADLVLDFDACKSVVKAGGSGNYNLKPVLTLAQRTQAGIQGYVSTTLTLNGTRVSAQQDGTIVRSTVPDANGRFVLPFLPSGSYDVVIVSEGRSTAVVSSVPVGTSTLSLNDSSAAIAPPASTVRELRGTASVGGSGTPTLVLDASVRALQALSGGPVVELAATPVDAVEASYTFSLPAAAPVRAPFAASGLSFKADDPVAGKYRLQANAPGRTGLTQDADISSSDLVVDFSFAP